MIYLDIDIIYGDKIMFNCLIMEEFLKSDLDLPNFSLL